ncbi:MAG TPA: P1 family peptidase [Anaerolineae bacterium]|nr:P1 family peptidase [Anaerolineae bacterium]
MTRKRLRDLGITIGTLPTGPNNAITDVDGVRVGHTTLITDEPRIARTGVTMVVPRDGSIWHDNAPAAYHILNGAGEMSGTHWLNEVGVLSSPIGLTNTHQVGLLRDSMESYAYEKGFTSSFLLPVATETYDGWLNDIYAAHVTKADIYHAIDSATSGPVAEGNVGGGTGMICHEFKGGIGTSSRVIEVKSGRFTIGVLVQANYGDRKHLRIDGVPIGLELDYDHTPRAKIEYHPEGSIIVIIATDAPLTPGQCKRLAQRATIGLGRVGGMGHTSSGDIFLAFATGNHIPDRSDNLIDLKMLPHLHLDPFFDGVVEATEEAIINALCMAETMVGFKGRTVYELPLDEVQRVMKKYNRL